MKVIVSRCQELKENGGITTQTDARQKCANAKNNACRNAEKYNQHKSLPLIHSSFLRRMPKVS